MSLQLLHQVYDETRRLAVAGSATAPGDFRLKKLIDPLKQAGAKAPVFAKLAESANAIIAANEQTAPDAMLELLGLATAIRYTQGETGLPGKIEPLGVKIPIARPTEISARLLQPLLQVLNTTGSGRLEIIQDAYKRGAFKDIRLMLPAISGLDDSYSEIAELLAKEIIPQSFGSAIAPYIKAGYDPKGKNGSARRLQLLHKFDPAGTRELVMQALEKGSKEVRVAALSCLGLHSDDVHILIEQTSAKAQDVRTAAYYGLSQMESEEAVNALTKIMASKELAHAWRPLAASRGPRLLKAILAEFRKQLTELFTIKDKKETSAKIERLGFFLHTLHERTDRDSEAMVLELFGLRDKLAKVKGDTLSGADTNLDVVRAMSGGTLSMANKLVESHAALDHDHLPYAFDAAHLHLPADRVYEIFSPYLTPLIGHKKTDAAIVKKYSAVVDRINYTARGYYTPQEKRRVLDPRWLDLAIRLPHTELVRTLARPGHAPLNEFLAEGYRKQMTLAKKTDELRFYCEMMAAVKHPDFETCFFSAVETIKVKTDPNAIYYYGALIPNLPATAIPKLEAMVPKLGDRYSDHWVRRIEELRTKPDVA